MRAFSHPRLASRAGAQWIGRSWETSAVLLFVEQKSPVHQPHEARPYADFADQHHPREHQRRTTHLPPGQRFIQQPDAKKDRQDGPQRANQRGLREGRQGFM